MQAAGAVTFSQQHVVAHAREWIGTPYHHQASRRGVGTDCLGLVRGIWRELYGFDAQRPPPYARDWAEATGYEAMLKAARRHLIEKAPQSALPGDVLIFRYRPAMPAKHAGVMSGPDSFIHAMEGVPVSEVALSHWWRRRIVSAFSYPGVKA